jgi:hypothetical protein
MNKITVNKSKNIFYVANNETSGLTDLIMEVKNQGAVMFATPMENINGGLYVHSFVPTTLNDYTVTISSVSNGDSIIKVYEAVAYDVLDTYTKLQSVETKVDVVDDKIDALVIKGDEIKTVVDANGVKLDTVALKTDEIKAVVDVNSTKLVSIETKIDALPTSNGRKGYFA